MKTRNKLTEYYKRSPFGMDGGVGNTIAMVYAGPYLVKVPNTQQRKKVTLYHDLHHLITGYNNSRYGEGEIGAWELGAGCMNRPFAMFFNLAGMSTGLMYSPARVYKAFLNGCKSRNLYELELDGVLDEDFSEVMKYATVTGKGKNKLLNNLRFIAYASVAAALLPFLLIFGWLQDTLGFNRQ